MLLFIPKLQHGLTTYRETSAMETCRLLMRTGCNHASADLNDSLMNSVMRFQTNTPSWPSRIEYENFLAISTESRQPIRHNSSVLKINRD